MGKGSKALDYSYELNKRQIEANKEQDFLEALTSFALTQEDNSKMIVITLAVVIGIIFIVITI